MERLYECRRSSKRAGHSPLARLADHIPDPRKHRNHFYAHYANRVRGERPTEKLERQKHEEEQPKKRRCSPTWARLIAKVFQADPLVCKRCGGTLKGPGRGHAGTLAWLVEGLEGSEASRR